MSRALKDTIDHDSKSFIAQNRKACSSEVLTQGHLGKARAEMDIRTAVKLSCSHSETFHNARVFTSFNTSVGNRLDYSEDMN